MSARWPRRGIYCSEGVEGPPAPGAKNFRRLLHKNAFLWYLQCASVLDGRNVVQRWAGESGWIDRSSIARGLRQRVKGIWALIVVEE